MEALRTIARLALAALAVSCAAPAQASASDDDGLPNLFISPAGKPFRAAAGAPYPVAAWFAEADRNADGRIDHAEFVADAEAFFKALDVNGDGILDPYEVSVYEHRVAPEILAVGPRADAGGGLLLAMDHEGARLWLVQRGPQGGDFPGANTASGNDRSINPSGEEPPEPRRRRPEEEYGVGASPFSLMRVPEPVTAGDADFMFRGRVRKANYLQRADHNFAALDEAGQRYLTLATLPKTPVQTMIEKARRGRR